MNTTELIRPPAAPGHTASTPPAERPTFGEIAAETIPLVDAIAGYGPPVLLLAGPWTLFALVLSGPFAFLLALVVFMLVVATVVIGVTAAILAAPYLLVRRVRRYKARPTFSNDRAAQLVPVGSPRVAA